MRPNMQIITLLKLPQLTILDGSQLIDDQQTGSSDSVSLFPCFSFLPSYSYSSSPAAALNSKANEQSGTEEESDLWPFNGKIQKPYRWNGFIIIISGPVEIENYRAGGEGDEEEEYIPTLG